MPYEIQHRKNWKEVIFGLGMNACWSHVCAFLSGLLSDQTTLRFIPRRMSQNYCRNSNILHYRLVQNVRCKNLRGLKGFSCAVTNIHDLWGYVKQDLFFFKNKCWIINLIILKQEHNTCSTVSRITMRSFAYDKIYTSFTQIAASAFLFIKKRFTG